ncbi:hypothetical protein [Sphingomonas sp. CFBP 8760]|uniref:hypothetical protein n=1 Tax=Sphingomonas sp. CFBP 8760 TaxID=2775282 RepID=UPI0017872E40|nr:hypothetical protein [Sphingomonas sp. CFBP 8760]MBD8547892.1 hypothetical protein [Sphingomonas sp. CFBP 8760]
MATTIFDESFDKDDNDSALRVLVYATLYSPDDIQFTGYILLDDAIKQVCPANIILVDRQAQIPLTPFAYLEGVSAGRHNIKFVVENQEADNVLLTIKAGATLEVAEIKRGAR